MDAPEDDDENEDLYEITVWNHEGDVVKKIWSASQKDADEIEEQFGDDTMFIVVIEEKRP